MSQDAARRRGRPPLVEGDTTTSVTVRVPVKEYDRIYRLSRRDRVSVPAVFRRGVSRVLRETDADQDE